jgi:Domain of unknown function (DUF4396)
MLSGVILLWFILTALSVVFVATDIRSTPESPVLKWAFVLIAAYTGPLGAFLYVLGCREPLPGLHARYVAARWRQVLGSTMHCVAGDGIGILAGAVIGSMLRLSMPLHVALEYLLGFGFGWTIFQALFMRDAAGGSFRRALRQTLIPEFLSMNALMAGMVPVMILLMTRLPGGDSPQGAVFWFVMSMALLAGSLIAYPMNWWLVAHHLKHGMMTVRRAGVAEEPGLEAKPEMAMDMAGHAGSPSTAAIMRVSILSIAIFGAGLIISTIILGYR